VQVEVKRRIITPFLGAAFAILALVVAIDLMVTYRAFSEPERTDEGDAYTNQGKSERRGDVVWGVFLIVGGGALLAWALPEIWRDHSVVTADSSGMAVRLGSSRQPPWELSWSSVDAVRSRTIEDELGPHRALAIQLEPHTRIPARLYGASLEGRELTVLADDWTPSVQEVAGRLQLLLDRFRELGPWPQDGPNGAAESDLETDGETHGGPTRS